MLEQLKPPKPEEKIPELLTEDEIARLFAAFNAFAALGARNTAILALFLDGGLRLSELVHLKDESANLSEGYVKVLSKGRKECMVILGANSQRALLHYRHHFRPEPAHLGVTNFFLSLEGYPLTPSGLQSMFARLGKRAGRDSQVHPHLQRHSNDTLEIEAGALELFVNQKLGHSDLSMTDYYSHLAARRSILKQPTTFSLVDQINIKVDKPRKQRNEKGKPRKVKPVPPQLRVVQRGAKGHDAGW